MMTGDYVSLHDPHDVSRSWRRISTGKLNFLYSEEKVVPNYLKASTGSCHDVCKYGRRDEFEDKARRGSTLKRVVTKLSRDKIILSQSLDSPLTKSASAKKVDDSFSSMKCKSDGFDVDREAKRLPGRTGDIKKREASSSGLVRESLALMDDKKSPKEMKKQRVSSSESQLASSTTRKQKVTKCSKLVFMPPGRASLGYKEIVELNKRVALSKLKSIAEKGLVGQISKKESKDEIRKRIGALKTDPKKPVLSGRALFLKRLQNRSKSLKVNKDNNLRTPPSKNQKEVTTYRAKKSGLRANQGKEHKDLVEEKTLYVIKMETENTMVESVQNERCVIDSPTSDTSFSPSSHRLSSRKKRQEESEGTMSEDEEGSLRNQETEGGGGEEEEDGDGDDESLHDGKRVPRQRKNRAFSSEDVVRDKTIKVKLKRGKIMDVVASGGNSPRRLKFKRGRVLAGDDSFQKLSVQRSFKPKGYHLNDEEHRPRPVRIALKRQEPQRRKNSRGLFNNVIEETASKLVETRKSKVKALVGAFETVISLQESKSSAT